MAIKVILDVTFTIICVAIAIMDIQKQTIYNEAVAVLLVLAIVSFFVCPEIGVISRMLGAVSVSGIMLLMCLLIPGAFGGGDIKMMVPVGLFLGLKQTMEVWVLAVFLGGIWGIATTIFGCLKGRKCCVSEKGTAFPFGPALCMGSVAALWVGDIIIQFMT